MSKAELHDNPKVIRVSASVRARLKALTPEGRKMYQFTNAVLDKALTALEQANELNSEEL